MTESSLTVSSAIEPVAGGVIGLGFGYSLAPGKFSLKDVLSMSPKDYKKFYEGVTSGALTEAQKVSLKNIDRARAEYLKVKQSDNKEIAGAYKLMRDEFVKLPVSDKNRSAYQGVKDELNAALKEIDYKNVFHRYSQSKSMFEKFPTNEKVKESYYIANAKFAQAKEFLAPKIERFKNTLRSMKKERKAYISKYPEKTGNVRDAYRAFKSMAAKKRANMATMMYELTNDKNLSEQFKEIKNLIPKSRIKSAIVGAGLFTLLAGMWSSKVSKITNKIA